MILITVPENQRCPDTVEATKIPGQDESQMAVTMATPTLPRAAFPDEKDPGAL